MNTRCNRRAFLALVSARLVPAQEPVTRPVVSEETCPLESIAAVSKDGHRGEGLLRKPPGAGPFPAVVCLHGGLTRQSSRELLQLARSITPSRFLAAGYVTAVPTYRSRDDDPQSPVSLEDSLAVIDHVKRQAYVDPKSVVVFGCSGGGDLALQAAANTEVCAIVPEEPASIVTAGIFNRHSPKKGERYDPSDARPILENPRGFYTDEYRRILRDKLARIQCPILIIQGDDGSLINKFNAQVLVPELRALKKAVKVIRYPGEVHCFCLYGDHVPWEPNRAANTPVALKAFSDCDAFFRQHVKTKPKLLASDSVKYEPA